MWHGRPAAHLTPRSTKAARERAHPGHARPRARKSTLGRLLGSEVRAKVLSALLLGSEERYYVRDLARRLCLPPTAVSRELVTLQQLGLVRRQAEGRRVYCALNPDAVVLVELRALALKLGGVAEVLRSALGGRPAAICWAFLFGSVASGSATAASDVDLFVVGDIRPMELNDLLRPAVDALGREISPFVIAPAEYRQKQRARDEIRSHLTIVLWRKCEHGSFFIPWSFGVCSGTINPEGDGP